MARRDRPLARRAKHGRARSLVEELWEDLNTGQDHAGVESGTHS
jgi:hypothetical protein